MVADLEFIKFKVKNLRRRWSAIQTWQNQDTDFGFSDVSMDNVEEKKSKLQGSVESLPSDDAEVTPSSPEQGCVGTRRRSAEQQPRTKCTRGGTGVA